ncbi:MAG: hypothetical protein ABIH26_15955 [Candidatus Eisenbacteria bacterium]
MSKGMMIGLVALVVLGSAGVAFAGLPCAAYCSSVMEFQRVSGTGFPCNQCDLVWCPVNYEKIWIRVTVRDCLEAPVPDCEVRLDLSGLFDPNDDLVNPDQINGRICGTPSRTGTTGADGAVEFLITGGGAGRFALHWVVTALCAEPAVELAARDDTLCIKSFDFNGTGVVNFQDVFRFMPQLWAGYGYSSDWRHCNGANWVNFGESFLFAPRLNGGDQCPGGYGESFTLTRVIDGLLPDCDDLFN